MQRQTWKRPERRVARCTNHFHVLMKQALEAFDLAGVVLKVECRLMMVSGMSMIGIYELCTLLCSPLHLTDTHTFADVNELNLTCGWFFSTFFFLWTLMNLSLAISRNPVVTTPNTRHANADSRTRNSSAQPMPREILWPRAR